MYSCDTLVMCRAALRRGRQSTGYNCWLAQQCCLIGNCRQMLEGRASSRPHLELLIGLYRGKHDGRDRSASLHVTARHTSKATIWFRLLGA